jgi:hypothetical protein
MTERISRLTDLAAVPAGPWRELTAGRPGLRLELLQSLENTAIRPLHLHAFLVEDAAGIVAAAVLRLFADRSVANPLDRVLFGRGVRVAQALRCTTGPLLLVGQPLGAGCGVVLRHGMPGALAYPILARLADEIERYAADRDCTVAFQPVVAGDDALIASVLRDRGYLATETAPTTHLAVHWNDLDGYIRYLSQRSRSAARTVRYESTYNERSRVVIRRLPSEPASAQALDTLLRIHYRRKNGVEPPYAKTFMPRLVAAMPDDFLIFEARRDAQTLGMVGLVRSGDVAWVAWLGVVDQTLRRDFTYFNLCFYQPIARAASLGIRRMLYGNMAYQASSPSMKSSTGRGRRLPACSRGRTCACTAPGIAESSHEGPHHELHAQRRAVDAPRAQAGRL